MLEKLNNAREEGRLAGQIELLDELLNLVFHEDSDVEFLLQQSMKINNMELVETLRELLRKKDLSDVKKMIMSL